MAQATLTQVESMDLLILGSTSMGCEVIEESEMEPFVDSMKSIVTGRSLALFGSYGWGTGEWKEEFLNFIKDLNGINYLQYHIAYFISPVLTGIKPASIIGIGNNDRQLLNL